MKAFDYFQSTEIRFGAGRLREIGEVAKEYGKRCLVVMGLPSPAKEMILEKVENSLEKAGVKMALFDGVIFNPTTESIAAGSEVAKDFKADVVLGVGGGSSMDSAKAIAVEATHEGSCWDYLYYCDTQPTKTTLPVLAVSTTSGTGSQVTQVAVVTNTENRDKSAIFNSIVYPKVAIVDPELMVTVPERVTASTGFDVFTHAFESSIHSNASPYTDMMGKEAMKLVIQNLPMVLRDGSNMEARTAMAWADTLAGLCIANAGVTLPHGIGMAISGMYPHVAHGVSLALNYPAFTRYTYPSAIEKFATMGRFFNPGLEDESDESAAERSCDEIDKFLKDIDMWLCLEEFDIPENELPELARQSQVLPDYKNNPRVATIDEVNDLLVQSYRR